MGWGNTRRMIFGAEHYAPTPLLDVGEVSVSCEVAWDSSKRHWIGVEISNKPEEGYTIVLRKYDTAVTKWAQIRKVLIAHGLPDPGEGVLFDILDYD